jgi:hypothetical protein
MGLSRKPNCRGKFGRDPSKNPVVQTVLIGKGLRGRLATVLQLNARDMTSHAAGGQSLHRGLRMVGSRPMASDATERGASFAGNQGWVSWWQRAVVHLPRRW